MNGCPECSTGHKKRPGIQKIPGLLVSPLFQGIVRGPPRYRSGLCFKHLLVGIRLCLHRLYPTRVVAPAVGAEYAVLEGVLIPSVEALDQLAPSRAKASVHLYPILFRSAFQAQIYHLALVTQCPATLSVGLYPNRLNRPIRAWMMLIRGQADISAVRATKDVSLLDLVLSTQRTSAFGDKLQLSITARRAYLGDLPAIPGKRATLPALWTTEGRFGGWIESSAGEDVDTESSESKSKKEEPAKEKDTADEEKS